MENMRLKLEHDIQVLNGIAFLEIAERATKEYEQNPDKTYPHGYFTQLSIEAQDRGWLFLLKEPYEERYDNLQTRLYHITREEEKKAQRNAESQLPKSLTKVLVNLIPVKPRFKGVAQ